MLIAFSAHVYTLKDRPVCYAKSPSENGNCANKRYALFKTLH